MCWSVEWEQYEIISENISENVASSRGGLDIKSMMLKSIQLFGWYGYKCTSLYIYIWGTDINYLMSLNL